MLFALDTMGNAGAEKSLLQILPFFSKEIDYQVVYLYPRHDLREEYLAAGIPFEFLDLEGNYDFWRGYFRLKQLVEKEQPDLLVSSLMRSNLLCRLLSRFTGIPLIGTFVNDSYSEHRLAAKRGAQLWKFKFFWALDRMTAGIPKLYISNSCYIAESHVRTLGVTLSKSTVVYRGRAVPNRVWDASEDESYRFISYGRLLEVKGFKELIGAFAKVNAKYPNSSLVIYGEGNYRPELEKMIEQLGLKDKVSLPGVISNVTEKLYDAECFVFPSWYEGFSGALVEAMMSGIPIIASDIPMNLEAVKVDQSALIYPVKDVEVLATKMMEAISNPDKMKRLGQTAREEAIQRFDISKIAKEYEMVLNIFFKSYS